MMSRLERINALAKKARETGLTPEEETERAKLRQEYLAEFRRNLKAELSNTWVVEPDGTKRPFLKSDES